MIRHALNPPNWFTAASIACSVGAVLLALEHQARAVPLASALIVAAGVFDLLDGAVARLLGRPSRFGTQLDAMADVLGFGLAPAAVAWVWQLRELGAAGALAATWFVLAAAFRLARFVDEATDPTHAAGGWRHPGHTRGLSTTMAGGSLAAFAWVATGSGWAVPPWAVGALVVALGMLMVSSVPFRSFRDARVQPRTRWLLGGYLAACLTCAVALGWPFGWALGALLYLALGPVDGLTLRARSRRRPALVLVERPPPGVDRWSQGEAGRSAPRAVAGVVEHRQPR